MEKQTTAPRKAATYLTASQNIGLLLGHTYTSSGSLTPYVSMLVTKIAHVAAK